MAEDWIFKIYSANWVFKRLSETWVFKINNSSGDMFKLVYDKNNNGIVDLSEGIRVLTDFPNNPKKGDIVVVNDSIYINL